MNQRYKTLDPFKGTHNLIRCEDISNVSFKEDFCIKYAFDCIFDRDEFLKGTYKLYEFNDPAMRSLKREVNLVPVYFKNNIYPSVNEVMLNEEDCEKSFLMISNSYSAGYYILSIDVNVIGSSIFSSKTINILNSDDLIGRISFKQVSEPRLRYMATSLAFNPGDISITAGFTFVNNNVLDSRWRQDYFSSSKNGRNYSFYDALHLWYRHDSSSYAGGVNRRYSNPVSLYDTFEISEWQAKTDPRFRNNWIETVFFTKESYTHKIANGQVYNPEIYPEFYKKFGTKWGGTSTSPKLPNLIGSFPRNIGTSGSAFAGYFAIDDPGNVYVQRIPKIKWMNELVPDHSHAFNRTSFKGRSAYCATCSGAKCGDNWRDSSNPTYTVSLKDNNWNNIQTGTNVNLNNYEFTNRFEPKCIEVIPFIRMI